MQYFVKSKVQLFYSALESWLIICWCFYAPKVYWKI